MNNKPPYKFEPSGNYVTDLYEMTERLKSISNQIVIIGEAFAKTGNTVMSSKLYNFGDEINEICQKTEEIICNKVTSDLGEAETRTKSLVKAFSSVIVVK